MNGNQQILAQMSTGPLFVVGMWRSGTSLLYALLNQHPQIGLMYESDILTLQPVFLFRRKRASWLNKIDFWNEVLTRHKIDRAAIDPTIATLTNAFRAIAQQCAARKSAMIWGCKSPNYYDCMNQLADWFPSAKFIVIWRDPVDVLKSVIRAAEKNAWFARPGMELRALLGYRRMKQEVDQLEYRRIAVFQLQYEDLIANPGATMQAVCNFIGVPFDPKTASLEGADRSSIYDGDHHAMVKSSTIRATRDRSEILSSRLERKIERYVVHWRKQSQGKWPTTAAFSENAASASFFERIIDRAYYSILRAADRTVPFVYAIVPTTLWKKYRQLKSRHKSRVPKSATSLPLRDLSQ
jgi:LPS sulfotransferase NodH